MAECRRQSLLRDGDRIVCLGDSITADPEGYVSVVREVLRLSRPQERIAVINAGVEGSTAADMLARFGRDVLQRKPTWVTISAGMNDAALGLPLVEYRTAIEGLLHAAESAGLRAGLCTTTVFEDEWVPGVTERGNALLGEYNRWLEETAGSCGLLVIPVHEAFRRVREGADRDLRLTTDGVHLTPMGRYVMGLTFLAAFGVSLLAPIESESMPA
jgi:acyl-CoA thioesterase I